MDEDMKYRYYYLIVFLLIMTLIFPACAASKTTETRTFKNISVQEAAELIQSNQNNPDFTILDVRTIEEFQTGHIDGAINLDFYSPTFKEELNKLNKGNTYFVYCRTGNRSGQAMDIMELLGFKVVYNLSAGISDWTANGLPTVK